MQLTVNNYVYWFCAIFILATVFLNGAIVWDLFKAYNWRMILHPFAYSVIAFVTFIMATSDKCAQKAQISAGFQAVTMITYLLCHNYGGKNWPMTEKIGLFPYCPWIPEVFYLLDIFVMVCTATSGTNITVALLRPVASDKISPA